MWWLQPQWLVTHGHRLAVTICGVIYRPPHHFPLHWLEIVSLIIHTLLTLNFRVRPLPFGSRRSSMEGVTEGGLWPFSQVPYGRHLLQLTASPWTAEASKCKRWQFGALTNRKTTSSNRDPSLSSLYYYSVAQLFYREYELRSFVCGDYYHSDLLLMGTIYRPPHYRCIASTTKIRAMYLEEPWQKNRSVWPGVLSPLSPKFCNNLFLSVTAASSILANFEKTCEYISAFGWSVYSCNEKELDQSMQETLNPESWRSTTSYLLMFFTNWQGRGPLQLYCRWEAVVERWKIFNDCKRSN